MELYDLVIRYAKNSEILYYREEQDSISSKRHCYYLKVFDNFRTYENKLWAVNSHLNNVSNLN